VGPVLEGGCSCRRGALGFTATCKQNEPAVVLRNVARKAFSGASSAYAAPFHGCTLSRESGAGQLARDRGKSGSGLAFCGVCGSTLGASNAFCFRTSSAQTLSDQRYRRRSAADAGAQHGTSASSRASPPT